MKLTIDQMITNICSRLGLEHRYTIEFCGICEDNKSTMEDITTAYAVGMSMDKYTKD